MKRWFVVLFIIAILPIGGWAQIENIDTAAVRIFKEEGLQRSQVMETLWWLSDRFGPRLTNSPEYFEAAQWAMKTLDNWGLENVSKVPFPFGKSWSIKKFSAHVVSPRSFPLNAYPMAWSPSVRKSVRGKLVHVNVKAEADLAAYKGRLKGAIVLMGNELEIFPRFEPLARRLADSSLLQLANAAPGVARGRRFMFDSAMVARRRAQQELNEKRNAFIKSEGAVAIFENGGADLGTIRVMGASELYGPETERKNRVPAYSAKAPATIPQIALAGEHFNRLARLLAKGIDVEVEFDLQTETTIVDSCYSVIAEIPGTDLKDEVVLIGAHFDSWHGATGTTDNGAGSAIMMEAMRILKASGLKPRRTIRIGLWGGEEQGFLGSSAYVTKFLAERGEPTQNQPGPVTKKPGFEKFSVYFNLDNGSGQIRGIYLQGLENARNVFRPWFGPFREWGAATVSAANTGSTDHIPFVAVGLPGFQFIQDGLDYGRTWHTTADTYEHAIESDMRRNAVIIAAFAWHAAQRDSLMPRP